MSFPIARPRTIRPAPVLWMTAFALFALVLTGCAATSGPSSSPAAEATLEPSVAAPTVTEPSVAASPTAEATASAAADGERHDAPALEVLLPDEIDSYELIKNSFQGRESIEAGGFDVEDAAASLDRDLDDVSIATATLADEELDIFVLRIEGASGDQILQAYHPDLEGYEEDFQGNVISREPSGGPERGGEPGSYIFTTDEFYVEIVTTDRYYVDVVLSEFR